MLLVQLVAVSILHGVQRVGGRCILQERVPETRHTQVQTGRPGGLRSTHRDPSTGLVSTVEAWDPSTATSPESSHQQSGSLNTHEILTEDPKSLMP